VVPERHEQHTPDRDGRRRAQHAPRDALAQDAARKHDVRHKLDRPERGEQRLRGEAERDEVEDVAAGKEGDAGLPLVEAAGGGEGGGWAARAKEGEKRPPIALQPFSPHGAGGLARVFDRLAPVVAQFHQVLKKKEKGKEGVSAGGRCHSAARLPPPAHRAQVDEDGPDLRAREVGKGWASRAGGGDGAARAVRPARASRRSLPRAL